MLENTATPAFEYRAPRNSGPAVLVQIAGEAHQQGHAFAIEQSSVTIGRATEAGMQLGGQGVSREHCKIDRQGDQYVLQDLGSRNGTFVNDERLAPGEFRTLREGDVVRAGETVLRYLHENVHEKAYHQGLRNAGTRDALTQAMTKGHFQEVARPLLNRAARTQSECSLILFDIDHFKKINDTYGHLAGDYVLRELASLVSHQIRDYDQFARWGGEEFAVMLPAQDAETAQRVAEKLRESIASHSFSYEGVQIPVTSSFGVHALEHGQKFSLERMIERADQCLYEAKALGRNRVVAQQHQVHAIAQER